MILSDFAKFVLKQRRIKRQGRQPELSNCIFKNIQAAKLIEEKKIPIVSLMTPEELAIHIRSWGWGHSAGRLEQAEETFDNLQKAAFGHIINR